MSKALIEFIAATMLPRLNNPAHPHNLPAILAKASTKDGSPLLPVKATDWKPGAFDGGETSVNIAKQWYQTALDDINAGDADPPVDGTKFEGIPLPTSPEPVLAIPTATITGLDNVQVGGLRNLSGTSGGYSMIISLLFSALTGAALPKKVGLDGHYRLDQDVCAADIGAHEPTKTPTKLSHLKWPVDHVTGSGAFRLDVSNLAADIDLTVAVTGTGADRTLTVTVNKITTKGHTSSDPTYTLDASALTIDQSADEDFKKAWLDMAKQAFDDPVGQKKLTTALTDSLNAAATLDALSRALTDQLAAALDNVMGPITSGTLAHDSTGPDPAVDQYLFDRMRTALADGKSPLYLPDLIVGAKDPVLEPYTLGKITIGEIVLGGKFKPFEDVTLDGTATGFSNALVPASDAALAKGRVSATVKLATLKGHQHVPDPPWKCQGSLTADWNKTPVNGHYTASATAATLSTELTFGGKDLDHLTVTVESVRLDVKRDDLTITVLIPEGSLLQGAANQVLAQPAMKDRVLKSLNKALDDKRPDIGKALAKTARAAIAKNLD
ncbi:hypothetical protein ACIQI7_22435 [Kitasatospora sp. NPDC092039]|uniref:hypothetical protein n=1 Tax=Kitasatospora sp. NPDC092039 TaxID=3364086 RepID=UPI0037FE5775